MKFFFFSNGLRSFRLRKGNRLRKFLGNVFSEGEFVIRILARDQDDGGHKLETKQRPETH